MDRIVEAEAVAPGLHKNLRDLKYSSISKAIQASLCLIASTSTKAAKQLLISLNKCQMIIFNRYSTFKFNRIQEKLLMFPLLKILLILLHHLLEQSLTLCNSKRWEDRSKDPVFPLSKLLWLSLSRRGILMCHLTVNKFKPLKLMILTSLKFAFQRLRKETKLIKTRLVKFHLSVANHPRINHPILIKDDSRMLKLRHRT